MDRAWLRAAQKIEYRDPAPFLVGLRQLEIEAARSDLSEKVKNLRTNSLKKWRELRDAALFCYGMGQRIGQTVFVGRGESQDYDFVASWLVADQQHFAPVQLKEVVPAHLNPRAPSLQATINALEKYVDSDDLTVAIRLNQQTRFDLSEVTIPTLRIAALWVFASISSDRTQLGLWGNLLETAEGIRFAYPT
jgi:hypothetical protein